MNIFDLAAEEAARQGVDPSLVMRLVRQESGGRANAVSPKGARGPMQLMPATAKGLGVNIDDPADNIRGGVAYLKQQLDTFRDPSLALAAYNAGPGAVRKYGGVPPYAETQGYVRSIMGGQKAQSGADIFGMGEPQGQASKGGSGADIFADPPSTPRPKPAQAPIPQVSVAQMKAFARGGKPQVSTQQDVLKSGVSGVFDTLMGSDPQNAALGFVGNAVEQAANVAGGIQSLLGGKMPQMRARLPANPVAEAGAAKVRAIGQDYAPQTTAGEWAKTAGQMLPAALAPGSLPQRVANVVLPTIGTEGAGQTARALGAGPKGEAAARLVGGLAGGVAASARLTPQAKAQKPMSLEELKAAKQQAYQAVDNIGAAYKPEAVQTLKAGIADDMMANELDADLHPKVAATVKMIDRRLGDGPLTLSKLDKTRQLVRANIFDGGGTPEEKRLGGMLLDNIDEFISAAGPDQMAAGDGQSAAAAIAKARDLNTRYRKVETLTDAMGQADINASKSGSGGNIDNATRQQLAQILKKSKNLTPDERALLTKAIKGGGGQNVLRMVGRLSPSNGAMPQALAAGLGAATGGVGLVTLPIGLASKLAADGMTKGNIKALTDLMAAGGDVANLPRARLPQTTFVPGPGLIGSTAVNARVHQ